MSGGLAADVQVRLGSFELRAALAVEPGETVAVLGPNGAGKTTLLRALAGLEPLTSGSVTLDGEVLDDPGRGTFVPPERRSVGVVFQRHLLFPHLNAADNVAFGLRSRGVGRADARRQATAWLERVGLAHRASAWPGELSGGQAQRVALARALAPDPRLLLLDEPFAALDATTRAATRRDLREHLAGHTGVRVLVTHDPVEAAAIADRLVVLEDGRVVQEGTPAELSRRPRSRYVADLVGVNLLRGIAHGLQVEVEGSFPLTIAERAEGEVLAVVHPRAVVLHRHQPEGTPRNVWQATVEGVERNGDRARVRVGDPLPVVAEVTVAAADDLGLADGAAVWVSVKATEIGVFPA